MATWLGKKFSAIYGTRSYGQKCLLLTHGHNILGLSNNTFQLHWLCSILLEGRMIWKEC
jgi:hypothetical protein